MQQEAEPSCQGAGHPVPQTVEGFTPSHPRARQREPPPCRHSPLTGHVSQGAQHSLPHPPRALLIWGRHSGRGTLVQRSLEGSHPLCSPLHPCRLLQARTALIVKHSVSLAAGQRRVLSRCRLLSTCMRYMPRVRPCALTNEGALFCAPLLRPPSQIHA